MTTTSTLSIRGAREHNLKHVDVDIPRNSLTVITGLSGSGKSSLAFDTIYAEGQRRYVESLSAYARQFLEMMHKPDVDSIDGLSPAISIEQKTTSKNPRSTVGTVTEIYDYMRLMWARIGVPYSPATGLPITSQTVGEIVTQIQAMGDGTRLYILAPIVRGRKGEYKKDFQTLQAKGFARVKVDGKIYDIDAVPALDKKIKHDISVVVDRMVIRTGDEDDGRVRLADSVETALGLTDGLVIAVDADTDKESLFSATFACPVSGFTIAEIEPRLFSFNNPHGACPSCDGLGVRACFDPDLIIPDPSLSIDDGAIAPWGGAFKGYYLQILRSVAAHFGFSTDVPWAEMDPAHQEIVLQGSGTEKIRTEVRSKGQNSWKSHKPFEGVVNNLTRRLSETDSNSQREKLQRFQSSIPCTTCNGARLKPEALAVKIDGLSISDVTQMGIAEAAMWFRALSVDTQKQEIARPIVKEIDERLHFLLNVGLDYLTLSRTSGTLSGGESQRIRLASQIGSGLTGVLYVLDEPSIGLHQRDNNRLLETLTHLRNLGNTVIVVEHDEDAIRAADYVIDMGPGAGVHGGTITASGSLEEVMASPDSLTADYLSGRKAIPVPPKRRTAKPVSGTQKGKKKGQYLKITGARGNNLKGVDAAIPLGTLTCVTGVSGSGKSTLTIDTFYRAVSQQLMNTKAVPLPYNTLSGLERIDKVIDIDQSPIGRTPRSNPATYIGAFAPIREWFAGLPEAKARGYKPGRFSFNVKGGRCEACSGDGVIKIEMHFLPDVYVTCEHCNGKRYNRETLDVQYKGKSIADVLDMSVEQALEFFQAIPTVRDKLQTLMDVGLGYIKVGQQATTLSGGEAQRVKLSKELSKRSTGKTLYILDEPTTGLHFEDVRKLLEVLHKLVDQGNTVVVIEHNLDVIKTADYILDIGPEGGDKGGTLLASGTPEDIAAMPESYTGQFLKSLLHA